QITSDRKVEDLSDSFGLLLLMEYCFSASMMMRFIAWTTLTGCLPTEVSALSITASAPSRTALATSVTSALVGEGFCIMLSIICVATMTGRALWMHLLMISFWIIGRRSMGTSTPRSPRAIMIPLLALMILSILSTASGFSILAMILALCCFSSI